MVWETLLPLLVHIQANLDGDLGLAALSRRAGLSPAHLQRVFTAGVGESPRHYVERLRLERGAFRMLVHDASLLEIALDCGYHNHETFSRAFRRRFGKSPKDYRAAAQARLETREPAVRDPEDGMAEAFALSATKVRRLRPMHLAFIRHVGPYESVPNELFDALEAWAVRRGLPQPRVWLGIGHDAPGATPESRLRFDAALVVGGPFAPEGNIAHQLLPGGDFAITTHAGAMDTLPAAYATIFERALALEGWKLIGLPAVEIYHETAIDIGRRLQHTDICLPVTAR